MDGPLFSPTDVAIVPKAWGRTRCLRADPQSEVWVAECHAGGFSSRHFHRHKANQFFVHHGRLAVTAWRDGESVRVVLGPGQSCTVAAGVVHQFLALTDVVMVETYYPRAGGASTQPEDIVRLDEGGRKEITA